MQASLALQLVSAAIAAYFVGFLHAHTIAKKSQTAEKPASAPAPKEKSKDSEELPLSKPIFAPGPPKTREEYKMRRIAIEEYKQRQRQVDIVRREKIKAREAEALEAAQLKAEQGASDDEGDALEDGNDSQGVPVRLQRAERVLRWRTGRFLLVLEACYDTRNQQAVLRTAEAMGLQHVWIVQAEEEKNCDIAAKIVKGSIRWLTIRRFGNTQECIDELLSAGYQIWATDLHPQAECLSALGSAIPDKVAIVIGREADGVSQVMLNAAHKRVYLQMHGFTGSYNLSVASALVLQALFTACPEARGDLATEERNALRRHWYERLNRSITDRERFEAFRVLAEAGTLPMIDDLRIEQEAVARIPPKIKKRMQKTREQKQRVAGESNSQN